MFAEVVTMVRSFNSDERRAIPKESLSNRRTVTWEDIRNNFHDRDMDWRQTRKMTLSRIKWRPF